MRQPRPGELREVVLIRRRADMPMAGGGVAASFTGERYADAKIEPVGTAVYQAGVQTDDRITHRVFLRSEMAAGVDQASEIVCDDVVYRVRRSGDIGGTRRFAVIEVEEVRSGDGYGF